MLQVCLFFLLFLFLLLLLFNFLFYQLVGPNFNYFPLRVGLEQIVVQSRKLHECLEKLVVE